MNSIFTNLRTLGLSAALAVLLPTVSHAILIAQDEYESLNSYTGFANQFVDQNEATPGASTVTLDPVGLTYPNLAVAGGSLQNVSGVSQIRDLDATARALTLSGSDYFISFLLDNGGALGRLGLTLFAANGNEIAEFGQFNQPGNVPSATIFSGQVSDPQFQPRPSSTAPVNGTSLFVLAVSGSTNSLSLYYNPTPGGALPAPVAVLNDAQGGGGFVDFDLGSLRAIGFGSNQRLDEIRVGSTYADVAPVPEPTALVSLVGGAAALLGFRRRRA